MPFAKGTSGNVLGRPKGARGVAAYVASRTSNSQEMIDCLIAMMRDERTPARERLAASIALLDRSVGRPMSTTEISMVNRAPSIIPPGFAELPQAAKLAVLREARRVALAAAAPMLELADGDEGGDDGED